MVRVGVYVVVLLQIPDKYATINIVLYMSFSILV